MCAILEFILHFLKRNGISFLCKSKKTNFKGYMYVTRLAHETWILHHAMKKILETQRKRVDLQNTLHVKSHFQR